MVDIIVLQLNFSAVLSNYAILLIV